MTRALPEWIGKTDDAAIPPRVKLRIFERYHGACQGCLRKIYPGDMWECDHIVALINGGEHRETNLRPLCQWCHRQKTKADVAEKSKSYRRRKRHYGIKSASRVMPGSRASGWKRKINGEVVRR